MKTFEEKGKYYYSFYGAAIKPAWLSLDNQRYFATNSLLKSAILATSSTTASTSNEALSWKETICDIVASVVGSAACTYTGQPFDTMKVRLQVNPNEFNGIVSSLRKTIAGEGVAALWKGSVPAMVGALSENVVAFATNGMLKRMFQSHSEDSLVKPLVSGAITGALSSLVLCPCDIIKCRAQVNIAMGMGKQSLTDITKDIIKKNGLRGLYSGFGPQLLRDVPFYAAFFGTYDILCALFKKYTSLSDTAVYFVSGGIAGQVGWAVSIAPDTIKSRIQVSDSPLSFMNTARQIIAENGTRGLFAGVEVAIIRAFPANAALFVGYEWSRKLVSDCLN